VPELYASLRPQVYEQDLGLKDEKLAVQEQRRGMRMRSMAAQEPPAAPADASSFGRSAGAMGGGGFGGRGGVAGAEMAAGASEAAFALEGRMLQESLVAAAQGGDIGELFRYDIKDEVTLARQRSAMLPIINDSVEGEKVSIYNPGVHAKHALNGVRLKNSSDLHLMQGPVTVFDGGAYAGDARIPDLPTGSERLLSYALDLEIEVAPTSDARPQSLVSARITKGVLEAEFKQSRTNTYTVKNSGEDAKTVLVEHPVDLQWELRTPKEPTEKTRDVYRFAVSAEPGKPAELKIEEQNTARQAVAVTNLNDDSIHFYLSAKVVPESVKEALREVLRRKAELAELNRQKQQVEQEVATIGEEQARIRQNMESIGQNTDLYNRYVTKFTEQEDNIERLREDARALERQIAQAQKSLDEFLTNLDLDSAPAAG
jgi:hypothetical protein